MSADLIRLFKSFDRGRISRRQLLQALGLAAAIRPAAAFAQGQCGGARAGTPECDPTPAKLPFERVGDLRERVRVRRALEAKTRVGREAERRALKSEERLVAHRLLRRLLVHEAILREATPVPTLSLVCAHVSVAAHVESSPPGLLNADC